MPRRSSSESLSGRERAEPAVARRRHHAAQPRPGDSLRHAPPPRELLWIPSPGCAARSPSRSPLSVGGSEGGAECRRVRRRVPRRPRGFAERHLAVGPSPMRVRRDDRMIFGSRPIVRGGHLGRFEVDPEGGRRRARLRLATSSRRRCPVRGEERVSSTTGFRGRRLNSLPARHCDTVDWAGSRSRSPVRISESPLHPCREPRLNAPIRGARGLIAQGDSNHACDFGN